MRKIFAPTVLAAAALLSSPVVAAPIIIGNYYEENLELVCPGTYTCAIIFSAAPTGKRVLTRYIDCQIEALNNSLKFLTLQFQGGNARVHPMVAALQANTEFGHTYAAHYETTVLFGDNKPFVYYEGQVTAANQTVRMKCSLTGELVNK